MQKSPHKFGKTKQEFNLTSKETYQKTIISSKKIKGKTLKFELNKIMEIAIWSKKVEQLLKLLESENMECMVVNTSENDFKIMIDSLNSIQLKWLQIVTTFGIMWILTVISAVISSSIINDDTSHIFKQDLI